MRALIIETAFIGDVIVSLGLAGEIKRLHPDSFVAYLVRPEAVEITRACPHVDQVIAFDKYGDERGRNGARSKAKQLNDLGFDVVLALHSSHRTQLLVSQLTATTKVGFDSMRDAGLTHHVPDTGWENRYSRAVMLLAAIEPRADLAALPQLSCGVHPEAVQFASRFGATVALAPGSVWATKKWGDDKFAGLASLLAAREIGVVVVGDGASCNAATMSIAAAGENIVLDLTGRATLVESGAAIAAASLLVSNDSAPAHIGVAVGTPVVTIFGPTVPAMGFAPPMGRGAVVEMENLWCRPCASHGSNTCPIYTHECMTTISPERVLATISEQLALQSA